MVQTQISCSTEFRTAVNMCLLYSGGGKYVVVYSGGGNWLGGVLRFGRSGMHILLIAYTSHTKGLRKKTCFWIANKMILLAYIATFHYQKKKNQVVKVFVVRLRTSLKK